MSYHVRKATIRSDEAAAVVCARLGRTTPPPLRAPRTSRRSRPSEHQKVLHSPLSPHRKQSAGRTAALSASLGVASAVAPQRSRTARWRAKSRPAVVENCGRLFLASPTLTRRLARAGPRVCKCPTRCRAYGLPARASPATGRLCKQKRPPPVDTLAFPVYHTPALHSKTRTAYHARTKMLVHMYLKYCLIWNYSKL